MLEGLITSKTRVKMLLKFFTNSNATAYLRGLAGEFGESTNSIRHELNNLSKAGYLTSSENGRTIEYRANVHHPLYQELKGLVHKYLGIDKIIENIIHKLGDLKLAYITGDYAKGKDSGVIELLLVGDIDEQYLTNLVEKAKTLIHRDIQVSHIQAVEFREEQFRDALLLWQE
ncbi:MAG: ArsR family transcriptional regulator [Cyclobacteriaceae bacterium]|nr:ArsR family transcriptional regulator [Cyclobacteriaceae bacterium]